MYIHIQLYQFTILVISVYITPPLSFFFEVNLFFQYTVMFYILYIDLKSIPKFDHDLSIFDELAHQCNAVLLSTNSQEKVSTNSNSHSSNLMTTTTTTTTMINDYDRRFQRSVQKLTIPSWYNEPTPSPKISTKPSIIPTSHYSRESHRTPEIVDVHRPHSYRSCRSSLGTSPTPSVHSWHPNHIMDGMNFSPTLPSSSSSSSRRHNKYEKGIERVTKASQWYRPTQFVAKKENDEISKLRKKIFLLFFLKIKRNHYFILIKNEISDILLLPQGQL
jgi:hypothetical protein